MGGTEMIRTMFSNPLMKSFAAAWVLIALYSGAVSAAELSVITPDMPEYVEKAASEQIAVATASGPEAKADLCLKFAAERIREMEALANRNRFEYTGSLVEAWRSLAFDGAGNALRLGVGNRVDMTGAFGAAAAARREHAQAMEKLASSNVPEDAARQLRETAREAMAGAEEALKEQVKERERARIHAEMLVQARVRVSEDLRKAGFKDEDAAVLSDKIMERVRTHASVRSALMVRVCVSARETAATEASESAELAAEANHLAETGASEENAAAMAGYAIRSTRIHRERVRLLREVRLACAATGADSGHIAARFASSMEIASQKRLTGAAMIELMRQVRRCLSDGVPARVVFDVMDKELRKMNEMRPDLGAAVEEGLRAVEQIRETLRRQAEEHADRFGANRDRAPGRPASGKGPG